MVAFTLIGQLGLPDGVAGHENEALTWVGPGPQDYELAPANAGSVTAASITDATAPGRAVLTAASNAAIRTAIGASSIVLGTTAGTALEGTYAPTKTTVGLSNVDNTSDTAKPVSTLQAAAIAAKEPTITAGTTGQYYRGDKSWQALNKAAVGLSVVDNTSDLGKPISTATQAALDTKATDAGLVHLTGNETAAGNKTWTGTATFSSTVTVPDNALSIPKVSGLQAALDAKASLTAEIAEADLIDETDIATGLISGRRMQKAVDAYTGGVETIFWNPGTSSWPDARDSADKWIFDSKGYPAATAPVGHSVHDEWWKDPA